MGSSALGLESWLMFGRFLLEEQWLSAALGVFLCLEAEYLADGRPEALRARAQSAARVQGFRKELHAALLGSQDWAVWGTSIDDLVQHAPSAAQLIDLTWLERHEAWATSNGRDLQASAV